MKEFKVPAGRFYKIQSCGCARLRSWEENIIKAQNKINDYEIEVEYKISDVKKYHYSQKEYLKEVELQFEKVDNGAY